MANEYLEPGDVGRIWRELMSDSRPSWEKEGPFSGMLAVAAAHILRESEPDFYSKSIPEMLKEQTNDE